MELQRIRAILLISLFLVGLTLYSAWQREHVLPAKALENQQVAAKDSITSADAKDIPANFAYPKDNSIMGAASSSSQNNAQSEIINITTDVYKIQIDTVGGDIVRAELVQYPQSLDTPDIGKVLLDNSDELNYVAQSGLVNKDNNSPDSRAKGRAKWQVAQKKYEIKDGQDKLEVDLFWQGDAGVSVTKRYIFHRDSYKVDVQFIINNQSDKAWSGHYYGQVKREFTKTKNGMLGVQMYQGGALHTPDKPYKKVSFDDMKSNPVTITQKGGWAALLERYFLCAWIPDSEQENHYFTRANEQNTYNIGSSAFVTVQPNQTQTVSGQFFIGPEIADALKAISPGLELTIDYGILWPISQLLFWLLKNIHNFVGNWGWSIILVTLVIKLAFYKLSASSYRSMGHMRRVQPKIEALKERMKDDKAQFSQAMLELYKKEKINPLGGCLPILIQIPVFIALYYVLLESVELRQAPFIFWLKDLSVKDPYYVLPLIMGASMFLQQKMSPAPPDPMQAKIMMFMPVIFTVLFLSFPSGLVLYWVVNNLLSILQQWYITNNLQKEGLATNNKSNKNQVKSLKKS